MLLTAVMLATLLPLGLIDTAEAATGAQILTPNSGTSGTGANGGTWKCSSAGDTLTLTNYDGYPIETDATTIRFSGTNTHHRAACQSVRRTQGVRSEADLHQGYLDPR